MQGAHKINNSLGQALLCKRMGKKRIIAETGAGQHGVATVRGGAGQHGVATVRGGAGQHGVATVRGGAGQHGVATVREGGGQQGFGRRSAG